jgi:hypothetical protein
MFVVNPSDNSVTIEADFNCLSEEVLCMVAKMPQVQAYVAKHIHDTQSSHSEASIIQTLLLSAAIIGQP